VRSNRLRPLDRDRLFTRLVHAPRLKFRFDRAMYWVGHISPSLSYSLWGGVRELAFPLRPNAGPPPTELRTDIPTYADLFAQASRSFSRVLTPFQTEISWPCGRIFNNFFESVDAELYYSMIRFFRPLRIVEVGAGHSTWFARDALRANGCGTITAIDPAPRVALPREVEIVKRPLEEVSLSLFRDLVENDILFIDASHSKEEALYVTQSIYPLLRPGVLVHHHDISFPYLPFASVVRDLGESSEEAVILSFLAGHRQEFEVFTASAFVGYEDPDLVLRLAPSRRYARRGNQSSLWTRKLERPQERRLLNELHNAMATTTPRTTALAMARPNGNAADAPTGPP